MFFTWCFSALFQKYDPLNIGHFDIYDNLSWRFTISLSFTSPNSRNFAWNFGGSSTRAITWATFSTSGRNLKTGSWLFCHETDYISVSNFTVSHQKVILSRFWVDLPSDIRETGKTGENRKFSAISIYDYTFAIYISYDTKFWC